MCGRRVEAVSRALAILVCICFCLLRVLVLGFCDWLLGRLVACVDNVDDALEAPALESGVLDDAPWLLGEAVLALFCAEAPDGSQVDDIAGRPYAEDRLCLGAEYQTPSSGHTYQLDRIADQVALGRRII